MRKFCLSAKKRKRRSSFGKAFCLGNQKEKLAVSSGCVFVTDYFCLTKNRAFFSIPRPLFMDYGGGYADFAAGILEKAFFWN